MRSGMHWYFPGSQRISSAVRCFKSNALRCACFPHVCATIGPHCDGLMSAALQSVGNSRSAWPSTASSTSHVARVACRHHVVLGVGRPTAKLNHLESQSESRPAEKRTCRVDCYCDSVRSDSGLSDSCSRCLRYLAPYASHRLVLAALGGGWWSGLVWGLRVYSGVLIVVVAIA